MLDATVNTSDSHIVDFARTRLTLRWLFPDSSRPVLPVLGAFQFGRDPSCLMNIEGEGVSRIHAKVVPEGKGYVLVDANSTNGTYLNGERIDRVVISSGSIVRMGCWVGVFQQLPSTADAGAWQQMGPNLYGGPELREALEPARRAAETNLPVIVGGETGTGKEVVANAIHAWSGRKGEFCAVNCAALPENLVEGELFGYRRGAFTGADRTSPGYFRQANHGTLLLDEINELPLAVQAKLLRVLQEGQVVPLGETVPVEVDVRIVTAAQSPMAQELAQGRFREDLYMRLQGLEIQLPPLRHRRGDIAALFAQFLKHEGTDSVPPVEAKLVESLCLYSWPGNVRELQLTARRLLAVYGEEDKLRRRHLPPAMQEQSEVHTAPPAEINLGRLGEALQQTAGNLSKACARLNISRQRAYRLLGKESVKEFLARLEADENKTR